LEADRVENAFVGNELRTARAQAERIEREKRAAASASAGGSRMSQFPSSPQVMMPTMQATPYYRPYPYGYAQPYGTAHALIPRPNFCSCDIFTQLLQLTPTNTYRRIYLTEPSLYSFLLDHYLLCMRLELSPFLHSPDGQQGQGQTAAVLRGSTANGSILNLEINVSLLQSTQMTGLAMVLNSLVARTQNVAAATANAATTAASSAQSRLPVKQRNTS
jgi:hypothetical protein